MIDPEEIDTRVDVLAYDGAGETKYRTVGAGYGADVVAAHRTEYRNYRRSRGLWLVSSAIITGAIVTLTADQLLVGVGGGFAPVLVAWYWKLDEDEVVPEIVLENVAPSRATRRYDIDAHADDPYAG